MKSILYALYRFGITTLHITQFKDLGEILFFVLCAHALTTWLSNSKLRPLLIHFYSYAGMTIAAYAFNFAAVYQLLITAAPASLMLAVLYHQHTLQRSFIPSRRIGTQALKTSAWIQDLVRALVKGLHAGKQVICLIEHRDDLSLLFQAPVTINASISAELATMLINSPEFDQNNYLWVDAQGIIKATNAYINQESKRIFQDAKHNPHAIIADKTDAIVCIADHKTNSFTVYAQSKVLNGIPASQLAPLLCAYLGYRVTLSPEHTYAKPTQKNSHQLDHS